MVSSLSVCRAAASQPRSLCRPFRACPAIGTLFPGRCPGLDYCAPSGQWRLLKPKTSVVRVLLLVLDFGWFFGEEDENKDEDEAAVCLKQAPFPPGLQSAALRAEGRKLW